MALNNVSRFLASVPVVLKVWKQLLCGDSPFGNCVRFMSELDTLGEHQPAKRTIATEWLHGLPIVLQLSEKLPSRTEMIRQYIKALPLLMQSTSGACSA